MAGTACRAGGKETVSGLQRHLSCSAPTGSQVSSSCVCHRPGTGSDAYTHLNRVVKPKKLQAILTHWRT